MIKFKEIHPAEIENLHEILFNALNIEVPYDPDELVMAKFAIVRIKILLERAMNEMETKWLGRPPGEWPRIGNLPEKERIPFAKWLIGQTAPHLSEEDLQDGYYPWDYDRWKAVEIMSEIISKDRPEKEDNT